MIGPHGRDPVRRGTRALAGEPGGGRRAPARARLHGLRDRLRGRVLDGLPVGGALRRARARARDRALRARADRRLHGPRRARQEAQHGDRDARPLGRASRRPRARSSSSSIPGFLLGRTREEAIDSVVEQLGELRERLEQKDRAVPFGVEVMGRVRELGSLDDVIEIASPARLGAAGDRLRAHARDHGRRLHRRRRLRRRAGRAPTRCSSPARRSTSTSPTSPYANRNETKHLPYGEGTLRAEPLGEALAHFERPATVISEAPDLESSLAIRAALEAGRVTRS